MHFAIKQAGCVMQTVITEPKTIENRPSPVPSNEITVNAAVLSHKGCVRDNNEDNFFFDGDLMQDDVVNDGAYIRMSLSRNYHLFAVCDGMGGLQGGERASSLGVHTLASLNLYLPEKQVNRAIDVYADDACRKVYEDSITLNEAGREGTTLALMYLADGRAHIGNVGDSRVYLMRMGRLFQLSRDHSAVYNMMLRGELTREQMRKHPEGNKIGAFIGMEESRKAKPYVFHMDVDLCQGDRFMICSDGLCDLLSHEEIQRKMAEGTEPGMIVSQFVWRAMEMGGKDNTTCILVDVVGGKLPAPTAESMAAFLQM